MAHEIEDARSLQKKLLERHEGKKLDDHFNGEVCKTSQGSCYKIEESLKFKIKCIQENKAKKAVLSDLKLIHGIGEAKESNLKSKGYKTIEDLIEHPSYSQKANEFLDLLNESPRDCISQCFPVSNPKTLYSSPYTDVEDFLFFDIETLGLKNYPVILIGLARIDGDQIKVTQYLATDLNEEKEMISNFFMNLDEKTVFVSFNGRSFDLPFIKSRANYYRMHRNLNQQHLDLLHFSRRTWGGNLPNCRLQTIEKNLFNLNRHEDVPSSQVPAFYMKYHKTGNIGPLIPIIEHNKEDVITLARILSKLQEEMN